MISHVAISEDEYEGLQILAATIKLNLFDVDLVLEWLANHNFVETARWLDSHQESYYLGLINGFLVYEDLSLEALAEGTEINVGFIIGTTSQEDS